MSHILPPLGHRVRDLFEVQHLVDVSMGRHPVPCGKYHARRLALRTMRANPAVRSVTLFCVDPSNDQLRLVTVGPRGGVKVEWTFGPITRQTVLA